MPTLVPFFNFGSDLKNENPILYKQLNELYSKIALVLNTKTSKAPNAIDPPASSQANAVYDIGDIWVNTSTNKGWLMTSRTSSTDVTWTLIT